jgi:hypothetical protein
MIDRTAPIKKAALIKTTGASFSQKCCRYFLDPDQTLGAPKFIESHGHASAVAGFLFCAHCFSLHGALSSGMMEMHAADS